MHIRQDELWKIRGGKFPLTNEHKFDKFNQYNLTDGWKLHEKNDVNMTACLYRSSSLDKASWCRSVFYSVAKKKWNIHSCVPHSVFLKVQAQYSMCKSASTPARWQPVECHWHRTIEQLQESATSGAGRNAIFMLSVSWCLPFCVTPVYGNTQCPQSALRWRLICR